MYKYPNPSRETISKKILRGVFVEVPCNKVTKFVSHCQTLIIPNEFTDANQITRLQNLARFLFSPEFPRQGRKLGEYAIKSYNAIGYEK